MKNTIFAAMAVGAVLVAGCSQQAPRPIPSDYEKYELSGDVASIRLVSYLPESLTDAHMRNGAVDPKGFNYYIEFNEEGMVTLNETYNREGAVARREVSTYDGRKITEKSVFAKGGALHQRSVYSYKGGNLATVTEYDGEGNLKRTLRYKPGKKDTVLVQQYNEKDSLRSIRKLIYDELGREVFNLSTTLKGDTISLFEIKYDEQGRLAGMDSDNLFFGKVDNVITYGEDGQRANVSMTGRNGTLVNYFKYDVDEKGNWIQRRCVSGPAETDTLTRFDVRTIVYR